MLDLPQKLALLQQTKAKIAQLEDDIKTELPRELAALPAEYGFSTVREFMLAVAAAGGSRAQRKRRNSLSHARRRLLIEDLRADMTYSAAKKKYRVSLSTVYNVKKAAGLV